MSQSDSRGSVGQSADLRTRIKEEVLDGILSMLSESDSPEMAADHIADAVIRELNLQTRTIPSFDNGKQQRSDLYL